MRDGVKYYHHKFTKYVIFGIARSGHFANGDFFMKHHFVGIIGFGGEGVWHYRKLEDCENLTLKGVYDISDKRRAFAREKGIYVYGTAEAMLCDKEIDIVIIATPNDSHKSFAIRAMRAG